MSHAPLIVLKLGGSVLTDASGLRRAVHEVYRWRRDGWRVLAVVSSLTGRTDELLARCDGFGSPPDSPARAALAAIGEFEAAALLNLHLESAGIPAQVLSPGAVGLKASGRPTDAVPTSLSAGRLTATLADRVVVFPGFIALGERGDPVLLGRGGSDLTALFLAAELQARRCRLIKDVDGLYEDDPARPGTPPRRYVQASYADALRTDGTIIQHKAVRFAQARGLEVELGRFNASEPTRIGDLATVLEPAPETRPPLAVALLGHGVVGASVAQLLADLPREFRLHGVAVREPARHPDLAEGLVWTDAVALARTPTDVVVEVMGGTGTSARAVSAALGRGADVVTANKTLLAETRGLEALAEASGASCRASAAVGGSLPALEAVARPRSSPVVALEGILCGTANFVLERMEAGDALTAAVAAARRLGLAEADPARDLDGRDAADKLCLLAAALGGPPLRPSDVPRTAIGSKTVPRGARQVATLRRVGSRWQAAVTIAVPAVDSPLRQAVGAQNVLVLEDAAGGREVLLGAGAGGRPTAEAVLADLLEIARMRAGAQEPREARKTG